LLAVRVVMAAKAAKAEKFPGWLSISEAAKKYRADYNALRRMVKDGVFTRGQFSSAKGRPPIYLRVDELDAWKRGGVAAVASVKAAYERSQQQLVAAQHDLGGEG